jgi:hypothetical protein
MIGKIGKIRHRSSVGKIGKIASQYGRIGKIGCHLWGESNRHLSAIVGKRIALSTLLVRVCVIC